MPDHDLPPLTVTSTLTHPRGITIEVTVTVGPGITNRVSFPDINRLTAAAAAAATGHILDAADDPPF